MKTRSDNHKDGKDCIAQVYNMLPFGHEVFKRKDMYQKLQIALESAIESA